MKSKYIFTLKDGTTKEIYIKKHGKEYVAYDGEEEYDPIEPGTLVFFNGQQRVIQDNLIYFDIKGIKFVTYFNNWAAPKLTVESGVKVKSNQALNNLKIGMPLLIIFVIITILGIMFI